MAINRNDLAKRLAFGAVYVTITSVCTLVSLWTTVIMIAVTSGICCFEFLRMAKVGGQHTYTVIGTVTATLIPIAVGFSAQALPDHLTAGGIAVAFAAAVIMLLRYFGNRDDTIVDVALTLFGYLYTGLMLSAFILLRNSMPGIEGGLLGFWIIGSAWINDGFAYLGGSAFGKHKFLPQISPKKTWEGVIIGTAVSTAWCLLIPVVLPNCGFGFGWAAIMGIVCGFAGIIGDLTESHIKRGFDAKDSGNLMPGHGGLLDRSDSFIFVAVVAYGIVTLAPFINNTLGIFL